MSMRGERPSFANVIQQWWKMSRGTQCQDEQGSSWGQVSSLVGEHLYKYCIIAQDKIGSYTSVLVYGYYIELDISIIRYVHYSNTVDSG